ncbi:TetR/AcrR family transcriptional regulator [Blastococcus sp. CT_GayMR19]|uniref:TetR/AcrR family transcriptional regulator n=1 Tax=Blastococcus sp. CT_GayMR19 TaxID=2559608 RepID=UPI0010745525|nr:TetR/AcrR family transcriptional regulator [Blastococcus sp. CT_GayMR19]TFV71323.1 TetR/AcrR family transcriptional regulator [Blastococcus sp. CT_GayMR19]
MSEVDRPRRRRAETVERLLDAALETFAEIGFAAASVEDICSRGGFTRGAFYSSFRTKDELFAALYARETARNLALAEEQLTGIEDEADPVGAAVERCLSTFRADRTWVLVHTEYALLAARRPEAAAALRRHAEALHGRLTALIETSASRVGIRLTVPAHRLARIVLALHDGVVIREVVGGVSPSGRRAASDLERTALLLLLRAATTPDLESSSP